MPTKRPLTDRLVPYPLVWATHFKGWLIEVDVVTQFFQWWLWVSGSKLSSFLDLLPYCHINFLNTKQMLIRQLRKSITIFKFKHNDY